MNYANAAGIPIPKVSDKPRIAMQIEQLEKVLSVCHNAANDIEHVADRILGPVPQDATKEGPPPSLETVERRIQHVISIAEGLSSRLMNASTRLNSAV